MASKMNSTQALSRIYNIARGTVSAPSEAALSRLYSIARGTVSPTQGKKTGGTVKKMAKGGKAKK